MIIIIKDDSITRVSNILLKTPTFDLIHQEISANWRNCIKYTIDITYISIFLDKGHICNKDIYDFICFLSDIIPIKDLNIDNTFVINNGEIIKDTNIYIKCPETKICSKGRQYNINTSNDINYIKIYNLWTSFKKLFPFNGNFLYIAKRLSGKEIPDLLVAFYSFENALYLLDDKKDLYSLKNLLQTLGTTINDYSKILNLLVDEKDYLTKFGVSDKKEVDKHKKILFALSNIFLYIKKIIDRG